MKKSRDKSCFNAIEICLSTYDSRVMCDEKEIKRLVVDIKNNSIYVIYNNVYFISCIF